VDSQIQSSSESTFQFIDNRPEAVAQRKLQEMANNSPQAKQAAQFQAMADDHSAQQHNPIQKKANPEPSRRENNNGLPDNLKTGMENLSGLSLDDVKVHRNSDKPAQLNAHAYAQGTDIHLGSGQEKHLPHEAWHVVQQKQGRVKPTTQMKGKVNINDDVGLEKEADIMGAKAVFAGQRIVQKKDKEHGIKHGVDGLTEKTTLPLTSHKPSIQRVEKPTVQKKRERVPEEDKDDTIELKQLKKSVIQRHSKLTQLAINAHEEAKPGTRIMVVNPLASDTGDLGTVIRPSSEVNCKAVEFDNEKGVYYRVYFNEINVISTPEARAEQDTPEGAILKLMIDNAITAAINAEAELNNVMSTDETYAHGAIKLPAAQLGKCLIDCQDLSAEETAGYLYTTYFYGPLNRYLRNPGVRLPSIIVQNLIDVTHAFLTRAFIQTPAAPLVPKYRMELQAEWIDITALNDTAETGDALSFKAFTSTHPELNGVNGMWGDIESGAFGAVTKLALLVFQGTSKFLYPSTKYFPTEHEHILPPNAKTKIAEKYQIHWTDTSKPEDDPKRTWTVTVYHLTIEGSGIVDDLHLQFNDYGEIIPR
jgi:hypothetical protein